MSRNLERLLQKAKAARPQPPSLPANALPIVTERSEIVPARIDHLIAAGKLAEADRPRCVYWQDFLLGSGAMSAEQLALVQAQKEIAHENVPDVEAAWAWSLARLLECLAPEANSETGDSL
jgi:hypothetical protein